ncbi:VOC family protein [Paracoccus sp. (in: a-proteobacteria)]|uniref:VOC family protein n=1 Tax=Paracoccus sp. TaxID=267 RepID=UPI0026DEBCB5|nr:VOC family protein [Paracoccus sp. (in: a-proteobacteria)]MDO5647781.1 VOC family protein [Paracoccus sp. (in: a-proteobacteria)]
MTPIGHVALTVRNMPGMVAFYETAFGLQVLDDCGPVRRMGAGGRALMELRHAPARRDRVPAIFLLPSRDDLGRWLHHAMSVGLPLTDACDCGTRLTVSVTDPEGNPITISCPANRAGTASRALNLNALAARAAGQWTGAPHDIRICSAAQHIDGPSPARGFLIGDLGLTPTGQAHGATWYGWNDHPHRRTPCRPHSANTNTDLSRAPTDPWGGATHYPN